MEQRYIYDIVLGEFSTKQVQVTSWKLTNSCYDYKLVQFDVDTERFSGRVNIEYDTYSDLFNLEFWKSVGHEPLELEKIIRLVHVTKIVDEIDNFLIF